MALSAKIRLLDRFEGTKIEIDLSADVLHQLIERERQIVEIYPEDDNVLELDTEHWDSERHRLAKVTIAIAPGELISDEIEGDDDALTD
jgi:hypothetical protein